MSIIPSKETYQALLVAVKTSKTAPKTHKLAVMAHYHLPEGKVAQIAVFVSYETSVPVDTISRIMFFESQYSETAYHLNSDKSFDSGLFQINSRHIPEAKKMGLDIVNNPDDNVSFAIYLIKLNGLRDWNSSKSKWQLST